MKRIYDFQWDRLLFETNLYHTTNNIVQYFIKWNIHNHKDCISLVCWKFEVLYFVTFTHITSFIPYLQDITFIHHQILYNLKAKLKIIIEGLKRFFAWFYHLFYLILSRFSYMFLAFSIPFITNSVYTGIESVSKERPSKISAKKLAPATFVMSYNQNVIQL